MRLTVLTASVLALTLGVVAAISAEQQEMNHQHSAHVTEQTTLVVKSAWSRELPPSATVGAAFLSLSNHTDQADRLLSAESAIAEVTELDRKSTRLNSSHV